MASVIVIGGGEHARVVIEAARPTLTILGFADPLPCAETSARLGVTRLGDDADVLHDHATESFVLGIGAVGVSRARRRACAAYSAASVRFATVIHPTASVSPTARIGDGAVVFAGAIIQTGASIGAHAVVGSGVIVEHDVVVGDFVQIGPGAVIGGGTTIGEDSYVGLGARVRDHIAIGAGVTIAMGAVVTRDVEAGLTVLGVPARVR